VVLVALMIVPQIIGMALLSVDAQRWINRLTPVAGLAIQQTRYRLDSAIGPWGGFGVLCGYAAAALVVAILLVRRRDA
jgi:hypothetical protein